MTQVPPGELRRDPLDAGSTLRLLAVMSDYAQVLTPDGIRGFVPLTDLQAVDREGRPFTVEQDTTLVERVGGSKLPVALVEIGSELYEIGRFDEFRLVQTAYGVTGWLQ